MTIHLAPDKEGIKFKDYYQKSKKQCEPGGVGWRGGWSESFHWDAPGTIFVPRWLQWFMPPPDIQR